MDAGIGQKNNQNEEACSNQRIRGNGEGDLEWGAGGGRHLRQRECVAAAATDQALRVRDSQQTVAREARKHAGGMW